MKSIWFTIVAILFSASCYFSIQLLVELASDPLAATVYAAVAIALALTQYASLSRGINQWRQGKLIGSSVSCITWALLTALSIGASAGALIGDTQRQQQTAVTSSTEYQLLLSQIQQLQAQAAQIQTAAKIDTESGYRSRALKTLDKLPVVQNNIAELRQQLTELQPTKTTAATALFSRIAERIGTDADTVMTAAYFAISVLIELALTVSVTALTERTAVKPNQHQPEQQQQQKQQQKQHAPAPEQITLLAKIINWLPGGRPVTSYA
jgi:hypothetical protein